MTVLSTFLKDLSLYPFWPLMLPIWQVQLMIRRLGFWWQIGPCQRLLFFSLIFCLQQGHCPKSFCWNFTFSIEALDKILWHSWNCGELSKLSLDFPGMAVCGLYLLVSLLLDLFLSHIWKRHAVLFWAVARTVRKRDTSLDSLISCICLDLTYFSTGWVSKPSFYLFTKKLHNKITL